MSSLSVWLVNQFAIPPTGAGGTRHYTLAREMKSDDVHVVLVASSVNHLTQARRVTDNCPVVEVIDDVKFAWLPTPPSGRGTAGRLQSMGGFAINVWRERWAAGLEAPDVVVGSTPSPLAAYAALRLARRHRVPFVLEVRDIWPQSLLDLGNLRPTHPGVRVLSWIERQLYRHADRIITLLPAAAGHIDAVVPGAGEKVVWVPNGVDTRLALEETTLEPDSPLLLMYTGAHGVANDLDTVLDAAILLEREIEAGDVCFRLVGDGPEKARLVQRVEAERIQGVKFDDPVPKSAVHALLREAGGFLMVLADSPVFRWGVSPNKLFDYLLAARPVLFGVNTPVNPVAESSAGYSFASSDPSALAQAVRQLLTTDPAERAAMGARGRAYVSARHDMTLLARRFADVLREVVPTDDRP